MPIAFLLLTFFLVPVHNSARGDLVGFDLSTNGVGIDLENNGTATIDGVTINVTVGTNIVGNDGNAAFNAIADRAGVDTGGVFSGGGDSASELDVGETLAFEVQFGPTIQEVLLSSINLQGVGPNADDRAFVNIGGNSVTLETSVPGFDGNTDIYTPLTPIALRSGDTVNFTAETTIGVQAINFAVTAVPEPIGALMLIMMGLPAVVTRKRPLL